MMVAVPAARAGGYSAARFGGEHGDATSDSLTSVFYNPAGIARGHGTRIYVEGFFAYRTVDYNRDAAAIDNPGTGTPSDGTAANAGKARAANPLVTPFAAIATDAGQPGLGIGLALYVPYGGQAKWDKNDRFANDNTYPGAVDGTQRWSIIEGEQRSIFVTGAVAYETPAHTLAFGGGLNVILNKTSLDRARDALGTDDLIGEGNALIEVSGTSIGLGLGFQWQATPKLRVGASYQSQPDFGQTEQTGTLTTKFGATAPVETPVVFTQRMPASVHASATFDATPSIVVRLFGEWIGWNVVDDMCLFAASDTSRRCHFNPDGSVDSTDTDAVQSVIVNIPRHWKDVYAGRLGAAWHNDTLEVGGSVMYDSNAVPDSTLEPALYDSSKVIVQGGLDYRLGSLTLNATVGDVMFSKRTLAPRAVDPAAPSRNPDMAGKYASNVAYLLLGVGVQL